MYIRIVLAFWLVKFTKKQGAYVDSQIWHLLRSTGLVCIVRVELGFFVKSPHVILLVKGYVFPGL